MCSLVLAASVALLSCTNAQFVFVKLPEALSAPEGSATRLECSVGTTLGVTYHWELNGVPIVNTTRRYQHDSDLVITRLDRQKDSGELTCVARSNQQIIKTDPVQLDIQWIGPSSVHLLQPESPSEITPGTAVVLKCQNDGSGEIHHEWFRNTERLPKSPRYDFKKRKLHLKSVSVEDNGVYRCSSRNEAGVTTSETNFALVVKGLTNEMIETIPTDIIVKPGSVAQFDCSYVHVKQVQWTFREHPITFDDRVFVLENGTLLIKSVRDEDTGMYSCKGGQLEYVAELRVAHLAPLDHQHFEPVLPDDGVAPAAQGKTFQITCLPTPAYPDPIVWWKDTKGHTISDAGRIRVDGGRLIIDKADVKDSGKYTCVVENKAGTTEMPVQVKVLKQHNITSHPRNITVDEESPVKLSCKHSGMASKNEKHFTAVKWLKDGKPLRTENGRINVNELDGSLHISQTVLQDKGSYVCEVVTAGFPPIYSNAGSLNIIGKLKFSPAPINKNLEMGTSGKIHCKASGTPNPTVQWTKDDDTDQELQDGATDMNGTLTFRNVTETDGGKYSCRAFNSQGSINTSVIISIVVSPRFSETPLNPTEVLEGSSVMLHCQADGSPKPTVQWDKNLKMNDFDPDRFTVMENGTLFIKEVHMYDENQYGCTAGNSAGLKREEISLVVRGLSESGMDSSTITRAVIITISVAVAYIVLVVGLMVWCKCRKRSKEIAGKTENGDIELKQNGECSKDIHNNIIDENQQKSQQHNSVKKTKKDDKGDGFDTANSNSSANSKLSKKSSTYDKIALSRDLLSDFIKLGTGQFGSISVAKMCHPKHEHSPESDMPGTDPCFVLVKALSNTGDEAALQEFKRQLELYYKVQCDHVVRLVGLSREVEPHYMVLEYTDWGDLKQFLLATKKEIKEGESKPPPLQIAQILALCHQLAMGMEYISKSRLVHKDLASRNCVIDSKLNVKISHSASTKDIYKDEYYEHANQMIPLRWMPFEAVFDDDFSTKSDCYSFGWLVWEIYSQALLPFTGMADKEVLNRLRDKTVQYETTEIMAEEIKLVLIKCWSHCPNDRPSFSQLVSVLRKCLKKEYKPEEVESINMESVK